MHFFLYSYIRTELQKVTGFFPLCRMRREYVAEYYKEVFRYMPASSNVHDKHVIIITRPREPRGNSGNQHPVLSGVLTVLLAVASVAALWHIFITRQTGAVNPPVNCLQLIRTTDYTRAVHLRTQSQEMEAVQFIDQAVGDQPAALVQVINQNSGHTLDVYVYGCVMQKQHPRLAALFTQRGLVQGTASISQTNTLITSALDTSLPASSSALLQPLQQNVYREYTWHNGAFIQVPFPGLYPVASSSEAAALQQEADNGQSLPWSDPLATAEQMARDIFKWPLISTQDSVLSNDGTTAQVQLVQQSPPLQVTVSLKRLMQHDNKGLWFVTAAKTSGLTLDQTSVAMPLTSPFRLQGTGALVDGQTTIQLFDHTLSPISSGQPQLHVNPDGTYTCALSYAHIAHDQQGLLLIQSLPAQANYSVEPGQLLLVGVILG